jgi:hypothetical protein
VHIVSHPADRSVSLYSSVHRPYEVYYRKRRAVSTQAHEENADFCHSLLKVISFSISLSIKSLFFQCESATCLLCPLLSSYLAVVLKRWKVLFLPVPWALINGVRPYRSSPAYICWFNDMLHCLRGRNAGPSNQRGITRRIRSNCRQLPIYDASWLGTVRLRFAHPGVRQDHMKS